MKIINKHYWITKIREKTSRHLQGPTNANNDLMKQVSQMGTLW